MVNVAYFSLEFKILSMRLRRRIFVVRSIAGSSLGLVGPICSLHSLIILLLRDNRKTFSLESEWESERKSEPVTTNAMKRFCRFQREFAHRFFSANLGWVCQMIQIDGYFKCLKTIRLEELVIFESQPRQTKTDKIWTILLSRIVSIHL